MNRPIGTGTLFVDAAKERFMAETRERYKSLQARNKRKGLGPLPFSIDAFRLHVYEALQRKWDGVFICRYCRMPFNFEDVAADHAVPLSRGGSPALGNIEFPCGPCNDQKADLLPEEFEKLLAFAEKELPFVRVAFLKRLQVATKLQAGWAHNLGTIAELKKTGEWQKAGKAMRGRRKQKPVLAKRAAPMEDF